MSIRNIIIEPDPILRKKSTTLETVDDSTRKLLDDMLQTMYNAPGIGLAAVQIGILKRIIVIDVSKKEEEKKPLFLINPEIKHKSKNQINSIMSYQEVVDSYDKSIEPPENIVKLIILNVYIYGIMVDIESMIFLLNLMIW